VDPPLGDAAAVLCNAVVAASGGVTAATGVGVGNKLTPVLDGVARAPGAGVAWELTTALEGVPTAIGVMVGAALAVAVKPVPNAIDVEPGSVVALPLVDVINGIGVGELIAPLKGAGVIVGPGLGCELAAALDGIAAGVAVDVA
jgi:hypothetical protein